MLRHHCACLALVVCGLLFPGQARAGEDAAAPKKDFSRPAPSKPDEPLARQLSLPQAAAFLDGVAVNWTRDRNCGTCHTNYAYLLARPLLRDALHEETSPGLDEVRGYFEKRITNWDSGKKGDAPRWDTEVVATAATLALMDARTTGKLHPLTRRALDRMWTLQQKDGAWKWLKCDWPPLEHDDYFGAVYATIAVGLAPDGYARTEKAQAGLDRLRSYFKATPAPDLHHRAMLLWASASVEGLLTGSGKADIIKELLAAQRPDGGWSLPGLGDWRRGDDTPNDHKDPSDGYATGLVVFVLRQAHVPAKDEKIQQGVRWLQTQQRASGRWFTRSLNTDRYHFITNAGTSYAVLALHACDALKP
jgi:squalene-hopene/tetraprenyl-beta-curcumene cyclase